MCRLGGVAAVGGHGTEVALVAGAENNAGRIQAASRTDDLSSAELDRALARRVLEQVRDDLPEPDLTSPANRAILRDVLAECRRARKDLIRDTSTVVDVGLPAQRIPVRIVRAEFEALAREPICAGLSAIAHVIRQARDRGHEVNAIVLNGELARTPLIAELIFFAMGLPCDHPAGPGMGCGERGSTASRASSPIPPDHIAEPSTAESPTTATAPAADVEGRRILG